MLQGEYFTGCVDRVILNHITLPLLDTSSTFTVCGPRPAAEPAPVMEGGAWFQGAGHFALPTLNMNSSIFTMSLELRTFASEGLILLATGTDTTFPLVRIKIELLSGDQFFLLTA